MSLFEKLKYQRSILWRATQDLVWWMLNCCDKVFSRLARTIRVTDNTFKCFWESIVHSSYVCFHGNHKYVNKKTFFLQTHCDALIPCSLLEHFIICRTFLCKLCEKYTFWNITLHYWNEILAHKKQWYKALKLSYKFYLKTLHFLFLLWLQVIHVYKTIFTWICYTTAWNIFLTFIFFFSFSFCFIIVNYFFLSRID